MGFHYGPRPVQKLELELDDKVVLADGSGDHRRRWTVAAVSENFVALTRQAAFEPAGTLEHTVLDWRNGVRGPCDLIGQGWGEGTYSRQECAEMLRDFEYVTEEDPAYIEAMARGEKSWFPSRNGVSVSQRNWLRIDIASVNGDPVELRWLELA